MVKVRPVLRRAVRVLATVALDARARFSGAVGPALTVGAFAAFTVGAWSVTPPAGWFVGGVCALFLEFLLSPDDANPGVGPRSKSNR